MMKKLLGIVVLGLFSLLWSVEVNAHDEDLIFLNCKGDFPSGLGSSMTDEIIKIDTKKSKIIFSDGYEYISKRKWDTKAHDFDSYGGIRTSGALEMIDHEEYFSIDRFTGKGVFFHAKTKKSNWKLMDKIYKVNCKKVERAF